MNKVQCTGSESSLVECTHLGMGVNCGHWFDVGAACMPKGYNITIVFQDLKARRKKKGFQPKTFQNRCNSLSYKLIYQTLKEAEQFALAAELATIPGGENGSTIRVFPLCGRLDEFT